MPYRICCLLVLLLVGCSKNSQPVPPQTQISSHTEKANEAQNTGKESKTEEAKQIPDKKVMLDIPIIKQNPELKYGCEVTSLAMVLQHAGIKVNKLELADQIPKDNTPVSKSKTGDITHWGNPNYGFVGDITGKKMGYAVYAEPVEKLMKHYLGDRTINLTGEPFDKLLNQIRNGSPVVIWTTGDFKTPDRWESWKRGVEKIEAPLDLHAVVLVGFDENNIYVNDPLTGKKEQKVNKQSFIDSWIALGKQALSYR